MVTGEERSLEKQIGAILEKVSIPKLLFDWALEHIEKYSEKEVILVELAKDNLTKEINEIGKQRETLLEMTMKRLVAQEVFREKDNILGKEIEVRRSKLDKLNINSNNGLIETKNCITFAYDLRNRFSIAPLEVRRSILLELTDNREISSKNVNMQLNEEFKTIEKGITAFNN